MQVRLKSLINEGHFTREAKKVLHPFLPSHCSGVTEICHMALSAQVLSAVHVRLKSVINEGYFPLVAETVFRPYLPSH
jgi:hypothetical protein